MLAAQGVGPSCPDSVRSSCLGLLPAYPPGRARGIHDTVLVRFWNSRLASHKGPCGTLEQTIAPPELRTVSVDSYSPGAGGGGGAPSAGGGSGGLPGRSAFLFRIQVQRWGAMSVWMRSTPRFTRCRVRIDP